MAKIDSLKEKLAIYKEEYKNLFLLFLATITGTFTTIYQVLTHKVELYILIYSVLGLIVSIFISLLMKKLKTNIDKTIRELEEI